MLTEQFISLDSFSIFHFISRYAENIDNNVHYSFLIFSFFQFSTFVATYHSDTWMYASTYVHVSNILFCDSMNFCTLFSTFAIADDGNVAGGDELNMSLHMYYHSFCLVFPFFF